MRVIKPQRIKEFARQYPDAASPLMEWLKACEGAAWTNLQEVRTTIPNADGAEVKSGHVVTVFNIGGNKYRLIVAIKYRWGVVYVLRFMTHAEYDKNKWKQQL
jgi:mRNA interferase HigB